MKKNKISFAKLGSITLGRSVAMSPSCDAPNTDDIVRDVLNTDAAVTGAPKTDAAVTDAKEAQPSQLGTFGTFSKQPEQLNIQNEAAISEASEENGTNETIDKETEDMAAAMGFAGFGKKARTFDVEKLADQSRKEAEERNRQNIAQLTLVTLESSSVGSDDEELIGPPLPPNMADPAGAGDGLMGPPPPPEFQPQGAAVDSDEDDDGYRVPVSLEMALSHGAKAITAVAMDPAGSRLVSGAIDYDVKYWDFQGMDVTRAAFRTFVPHDGYPIQSVDYSCTGDRVLVVSGASQAKVYDRDGIELFECPKGDMYLQDMGKTKGHVSSITHACWHPKEKDEFLTSSRDGTCRIWHTDKPPIQKHVIKPRALSGLKAKPTSCCYSTDGLTVACVGDDGSIQMWDHRKSYVNTIINVRDCHAKGTHTSSICFSYDNKYYATRGMDETLKLWDIRKPKTSVFVATGLFNRFEMSTCLFSPNDQLVVTGTSMDRDEASGNLLMFNRNTWKLERHIPVGNSHVIGLVWHPRLNQICIGSGDGKIRILYDQTLSRNGAILAAGKRKKRKKDTGVVVSQQIITPHALPMFREERHKSTRKLEMRDRKDPIKSHRPDLPLGSAGTGGRVSAGGSTLSSYIIRNLGLQNKQIEDDEGDPREALLKFDKLAKEDPYWVSPAYAATQPKAIFRDSEGDATQQKNKKQKTDDENK